MRIDRRLTFIGVMLIVLSMTMATQFATTKVSYTYGIVHPSNADIRFVASDNSSDNGSRVLRVVGNATSEYATLVSLGDWAPNSMKNYTAAFAIVNEEPFAVTITHINISGDGDDYIDIWLHGNRSTQANVDTAANGGRMMVDGGVSQTTSATNAWVLAAGDGDPTGMNQSYILTPWDTSAHVRYNHSTNSTSYAKNSTYDWVWVQISLNILSDAPLDTVATGQMWIHFKAG